MVRYKFVTRLDCHTKITRKPKVTDLKSNFESRVPTWSIEVKSKKCTRISEVEGVKLGKQERGTGRDEE